MKDLPANSRATVGLKIRCDELANYLTQRYLMLYPGKSAASFVTEFCHHVRSRDDRGTDDPRALLDLFLRSNDPTGPVRDQPVEPMVPLILSTAFLLRARDAQEQGHDEWGWNYAVDAAYWCGLAQNARYIGLVQDEAAADAISKKAKDAAKGRHGAEQKTKEFAWQLARALCPDGGWKPKVDAARKIEAEVVAFAKKLKWTMVVPAVGLIDKWLSDMPDADQLFPTRRQRTQP